MTVYFLPKKALTFNLQYFIIHSCTHKNYSTNAYMFKEIEKFIKKSFSPFQLQPGESNTPTSCFKQIIQSLKSLRVRESEPLKGRMQETSNHSKKIVEQILSIKKIVEEQIEKELLEHIRNAVEPMIREIQKIQEGALSEEQTSARYSAWEQKAKLWLELQNKTHSRTEVIKTVTHLLFVGMKERIDQDLNIIANYQSQIVSQLTISQEELCMLAKDLEGSLSTHTAALSLLKEASPPLELEQIAAWKAHIDQTRNDLFENALQEIDAIVETFHTSLHRQVKKKATG